MRHLVAFACAAGLTSSLVSAGRAQTATFSTSTDLVVLQVSVRDDRGRAISGLPAESFTLWDGNTKRDIAVFSNDDAPMTIGVVVDSSISMRTIRDDVMAACAGFLTGLRGGSDLFALTFNEHVRTALPPEAPFTRDTAELRLALEAVAGARGKTALYDAVTAGVHYAARGQFPRKALVVISDGGDNASASTLEDVLTQIREADIVIHTVALTDPVEPSKPGILKRLSEDTGGEFLRPSRTRDIAPTLARLAEDIRRGYVLGFHPTSTQDGQFHRVRLSARSHDTGTLHVKTRAGYRSANRGGQ